MLIKKHYYCSNCNYHGDQEIQITNKMELLKKPKCPTCQSRDFYFDILEFPLKDDASESGGIPHNEYTLDEYLGERFYDYKFEENQKNDDLYNEKISKILNQKDLHDLNQKLKQSGIKPIPVRSKIEYKESPFCIDGLILEDNFSNTNIIEIKKFLTKMNDLKVINNIQKLRETNQLKSMIYELIGDTIDSFVYDICNYDGAHYTKEEFLSNIQTLTILDPHVQHELLFNFLYKSNVNTLNYYLENKDVFVEQYLNILT